MKNKTELTAREKIMRYSPLFREFPIQIETEFQARKKELLQAIENEPDPQIVKALTLFRLWLSKRFNQRPVIGPWKDNPASWLD